jgi:hypothetical protein
MASIEGRAGGGVTLRSIADLSQEFGGNYEWPRGNRGQIESGNEVGGGNWGSIVLPAARPREETEDLLGCNAHRPHGTKPGVAMTLGQSPAVRTDDERHVREFRRLQIQCSVKHELSRSGRHQIVAAYDTGDSGSRIIDDDGQLIGGHSLRFPDHEIAANLIAIERNRAENSIDVNGHVVHSEAPSERSITEPVSIAGSATRASAGINGLDAVGMWGARCQFHIGPGASARINQFLRFQMVKSGRVRLDPLGLHGGARIPIQAEPTQVVHRLLRGSWFDPRRIDVFDSQHDSPAAPTGHEPSDEVSPGIPQMLSARWRRSKTCNEGWVE